MDYRDIRTLHLLEEIEKNHAPSQRELAKKLNISLGLVNSFIKRLANKGYFKVSTIPKNRVKYILTPKGAAEKTRLTYEYLRYSFEFYKTARLKLRNFFQDLVAQGVYRVVFYGANDFAEIVYISLIETPIEIITVVDDLKMGENFFGLVVTDPARLDSLSFDRILITDIGSREAIMERILEKGIPRNKMALLE